MRVVSQVMLNGHHDQPVGLVADAVDLEEDSRDRVGGQVDVTVAASAVTIRRCPVVVAMRSACAELSGGSVD